MRFMVLILLVLLLNPAEASNFCHKQIKVAVVDTGLDLNDPRLKSHLCETGHKNFVSNSNLKDFNGHGTHIVGLIEQFAGDANYCLLIYKYHSDYSTDKQNAERATAALEEAVRNGANIVNFSGGGYGFEEFEYLIIKNNPKVTFVVAAGNNHENLDIPGNEFYPASLFLDNMEVVEGIDMSGKRTASSNYSKRIKNKELGENVLSYLPGNIQGYMTGTSQATAIFSGKLVDRLSKSCNN